MPAARGTMKLYLALALVLFASLVFASGVAAVTRGWVLPVNRRTIHRPRLHGWGQLLIAFALCCQAVFGLMISDIPTRQWGTLTGSALLLTGLLIMGLSQRAPRP
ncbi:hypothetical protein ACFVT5_40180 [Streptomyces sp. NPDC058001]|uniref:hypothetical protein n=1 Tax=Streptomyces sp. NPDC058001 TaxID=3346300 RepID=UPI0036E7A2D1